MKTKKNTFKRAILLILTLLLSFTMLFPNGITHASDVAVYPFDETDVLDDLKSSNEFSLINYPKDETGLIKSPAIINVVEFCYSPTTEKNDFAIYLYFYNPQVIDISAKSLSNRVQMATKYDALPTTADCMPLDYDTFPLIFCNKSSDNLFYKFRIGFSSTDLALLFSRLNNNERRYDFSGITLADNTGTVKEYPIGGKYIFTGFAKGYGADVNAESNLQCTHFASVESIDLDVYSTTYRSASSSLGAGHQNDITSVYFSVPDKYIYETKEVNGQTVKIQNGNLQKIKAQWWEYKTQPIIVTDDTTIYNGLREQIGATVPSGTNNGGWGLMLGNFDVDILKLDYRYSYGFNVKDKMTYSGISYYANNYINGLYWLFPVNSLNVKNGEILLNRNAVESWAKTYTKSAKNGYLPIKDGKISADLFLSTVDAGRTKGYNVKEFDANNTFNILDYDSTHSAWDKFWKYGFSKIETNDGRQNVSPIEQIAQDDVNFLSAELLADKYIVNPGIANNLQTFAKNSYSNNEVPYIFHFAQTDYQYSGGFAYYNNNVYGNFETFNNGEIVRGTSIQASTMTVFFDFKIITLTFLQDNVYKTIPVTQDPIDIFSDVTKGAETEKKGCENAGQIAYYLVVPFAFIIGLIFLAIELVLLKQTLKIGNTVIKIIVFAVVGTIFVIIDFIYINAVIDLIATITNAISNIKF